MFTVKDVPSRESAIVLDTLSGLVARAHGDESVWTPNPHPAYQRWFKMMLDHIGARGEGPFPIWELVRRFHEEGIVKGYILYRYDASSRPLFEKGKMDTSVNAATSLCASLNAVAVSEGLESDAKAAGLSMLLDARNLSEDECFDKYKDKLSKEFVALQEPKVNEIRSESVALGAMILSGPGATYEKVLASLKPDTPVLGWGVGDEMEITRPTSQHGHFITATNWCHDLPLLSTEKIGATYPAEKVRQPNRRSLWDLDWETDVHYVSFIMSDGDNVQWLMGDFIEDQWRCYWSNPNRGHVPIGWTTCYVDLAQLCPYALDYLFQTASSADDFVLFGGGYYYPDLFGSKSNNKDLLELHAQRIGRYMQLGNINLLAVNCEKWDSGNALNAYNTYAREIPDLNAIYAIQYAPYTAGGGAIKWARRRDGGEVPVVSARFSIWGNVKGARDASPTVIAGKLNAMPYAGGPDTADHFTWVVVHAWSWFKKPEAGAAPGTEEIDQAKGGQPGTGRGLDAAKWCVDALAPHVKVVTPSELALLIRLHLRPPQTLSDELKALRRRLGEIHDPQKRFEAGQLIIKAQEHLNKAQYKACFETGKKAVKLVNMP